MTDPNRTVTKAHTAAAAHLQPLQANRDAVQAQTAAWQPNTADTVTDNATDPPTEGSP